jgi:AcrR family transcriptional regulator
MRQEYHSAMRKSSAKKPRLNQRRRTREALVKAATEAVRRGETPTPAEAAEAAGISRATAYRYFPNQQALLLEVTLDAIGAGPDPRAVDTGTVESRVDAAIAAFVEMAVQNERPLRSFLMLSMEQWLRTHGNGRGRGRGNEDYPVRQGRRVPWIERALAPLHWLSARERRRLTVALSMLCGIEAMVIAKDVCGCTAAEAEATSRWAAQAILHAAVSESRRQR